MITTSQFELPPDLLPHFRRAKRMEWITLIYLFTVTGVMYFAMGSSQAMKAAWIEDVLSMVPSISFLVAARFYGRKPNRKFPYGYHRTFTIAFLCGSVALFSMGLFLLTDSAVTLILMERPSIGAQRVGDQLIWLGYLMYAALLYSAIPAIILGHKKLPLAEKLHNKILYTDADTQKADWKTAFAAMVGITGIGFGLWWADSVAAIFISWSVLSDGFQNVKKSVQDLLERRPHTVAPDNADPLLSRISEHLQGASWIREFAFRFRENGQVYFGEVFVVPATGEDLVRKIESLKGSIRDIHWKIHDVTIMPVDELPQENLVTE